MFPSWESCRLSVSKTKATADFADESGSDFVCALRSLRSLRASLRQSGMDSYSRLPSPPRRAGLSSVVPLSGTGKGICWCERRRATCGKVKRPRLAPTKGANLGHPATAPQLPKDGKYGPPVGARLGSFDNAQGWPVKELAPAPQLPTSGNCGPPTDKVGYWESWQQPPPRRGGAKGWQIWATRRSSHFGMHLSNS